MVYAWHCAVWSNRRQTSLYIDLHIIIIIIIIIIN